MAIGNMGGAGGSWNANGAGGSWANEEEEKKKRERLRNTNGVLGMSGLGQIANEAAARNQAQQEVRTPYNSTPESRAKTDGILSGIGINTKNPYVTGVPKQPTGDMGGRGVRATNSYSSNDTSDLENPIMNEMSRGNNGKGFGLSVDNNAAVAKPLAPAMGGGNSGFGFSVMPPPRKAYGEDSRRAALAMDIKPYKNGMGLTTGQVALKNSILNGDDEKYANEQYTTQMNAAQGIAKAGMEQSGANSRAQLAEGGANSRANQQLGFDAEKFQQVAALDNRKLDMQQSNDNVSNFAPKRLNGLYEKYDAAESDEDRSAIASQIQSLSGTSKPQSPVLVNNTGQTATGDSMAPLKDNAAMLYLPDSREWVQPPTAERTSSDTPMLAIQQSGKFTKEQKGEIYDIYMAGGDISGYLE